MARFTNHEKYKKKKLRCVVLAVGKSVCVYSEFFGSDSKREPINACDSEHWTQRNGTNKHHL